LPTSNLAPGTSYQLKPNVRLANKDITIEDREPYRAFPLTRAAIDPDRETTIAKIIEIPPLYLSHAGIHDQSGWGTPYQPGDYLETCTAQEQYLPLTALFRERELPDGCFIASTVAAAFLRSVNIPAAQIMFEAAGDTIFHGAVWLPHSDNYSHGDWLAMGHAGTPGGLLLYNWEKFLEVTQGDGWITPAGVPDAIFGAEPKMNNANELYIFAKFATKPQYKRQGFNNDINDPWPQVKKMVDKLKPVYQTIKFIPDPNERFWVDVISDPLPPASFEDLRNRACQ
jgi:hypothetical protein